LVLGWNS